jgi:hypothetical protein
MTENKSVDTVLCFGESYTGNYFKGKKNARVTGTFTFDAAYKKRNLNRPVFPVKKILVSTFTFSPADINCRYSDNERYLDDILTVIRSYEEKNGRSIHVALRPHPSDSPEFYRWYLDRSGFPGIEIRSGGGFQECVSGFDLFFGSYSTTVFESAAMGIPVIFYHPCNQMLYPPYDGSCNDLPSAFSREELARVFARVMEDRDFACGFTRRDVLKPYTGEMEGNAAQRIMREVISMTEH